MLEKIGIGIDVVEIKRFQDLPYFSNKKFYKKLFFSEEIEYCLKYKDQARHFAGKFALKEAAIKSIPEKVDFLDFLTYHSDSKPFIELKTKKNYQFLASISHEMHIAIGVVVSERLIKK